jgi:hypothetical protein
LRPEGVLDSLFAGVDIGLAPLSRPRQRRENVPFVWNCATAVPV